MVKRMVGENRYGKMVQFTKDIGKMIWRMEMADLFNLEVIAIKVNGLMIRLRAREFTIIMMVLLIRENGIMINSMDMAMNNGVMDQNIKAIMSRDSKKVMGVLLGLMATGMKDNLKQTIFKDLEDIRGLMEGSMKDSGKIIKCTVKEHSFGLMEENTRETT
jgi:hypothetical protein